ncbi:helix-turn-helix domain-containing protein [Desulfatitalea tepidiphila]|uniref:helix-turn-helix domain-containing protein n=1 Tax=Desulfatitalea tepidiphila TaxID=1185843 RepID=UPI000976AB98|nr:helix-turn-helix transcriptional regulator [Desulfatitalea tepidiphila]
MNIKLKLKIIEHFGTQADFAQKIGTDDAAVSRVVRGRRTLPEDKQVLWAEMLQCDREEIF